MSGEGDDKLPPIGTQLREEMRRHNLTFEQPETALQPVQRQNQGRTWDKKSGRKHSSNHSTKEEEVMQTSNVVGRDVGSHSEGHVPLPPPIHMTEAQRQMVERLYGEQLTILRDMRNPVSLVNCAKYAITAGAGVGLFFAVSGIASLFKGPEVVTVKPAVMGK
jgi:hypothetical protein